jgi:SP family general alpha glucoside:H+ symporter-like MFS transporter
MDKEDLESNHVEVTSDERLGVLANQEDRETGRIASVLKYPWACAWCVYATWCIVLVSFDIQAGGSVLGIPEFRKDFGYAFDGSYVLDAKWQSAFNAAPIAS